MDALLRESGFQYVFGYKVPADACHKARSLLAPLSSLAPGPRQQQTFGLPKRKPSAFARIPDITLGIGFLGHPSHRRLRMVPCSSIAGEPPMGYSVPSVHFFFVTLGRCFTPGLLAGGYHTRLDCMVLRPSPFGACRLPR